MSGTYPFGAHGDSVNQTFSIVGVVGTLGTADSGGTANILPIGVDPSTGAAYVYNLGPAGSTTVAPNLPVIAGTPASAGTPLSVRLTDGTNFYTASGGGGGTNVNVVTGTINVGTSVITTGTIGGKAASGALGVANPVQIAGTDGGGTVYSPLISTGGILTTNLTSSGTILNLATGTLASVTTVTTVSNLTNGSANILTGTINTLASGTITTGTVSMTTGTLNGGTLTNLNYGTVNIDPTPIPVGTLITSYGTTGTTGAAVFGTLVAAVGAGTKAYISGYQIIVASGTVDSAILIGTFTQTVPAGGTNMVTRGQFVPSAGIARDRAVPYVSGTNGTICYWMGGAGTVYFQVDYWAAT